ncbi:hypothetical protein [Salipiger thiooxidans]|nr:hypothetical protein [Salipiger thiooxidans]MCA0849408.1 hypothetical protein [Salipiger thiooxidans]
MTGSVEGTTEQIAAVVRLAAEGGLKITARTSNTSICGGRMSTRHAHG